MQESERCENCPGDVWSDEVCHALAIEGLCKHFPLNVPIPADAELRIPDSLKKTTRVQVRPEYL